MKLIALRSHNGKYVGLTSSGRLTANKDAPTDATVFQVTDISAAAVGARSGSAVALKAPAGKFVCAEGGGGREVIANRDNRATWETFTLYDVDRQGIRSGGKIALRAFNGQFVCAEGGGGQELIANRANLGRWETFTVESRDPVPTGPQMVQTAPAFVDGVFEGGGALGVAYVGALRALEPQGLWFRRVAGNSAGAITACMVAAGLTAAEMEYLSAPPGTRERPASLPPGLEPIAGHTLQDLPRNASEIPQSLKRATILHHLLRASLIDEVLAQAFAAAPDPATYADAVMATIPNTIGAPGFKHTVGEKKISVTTPEFRWGRFTIPAGHHTFEWTVPAYEIDIPADKVSVDLGPYKTAIRAAVVAQLNAIAAAARTLATAMSLPAARMAFADGVMDRLLNDSSFLRAFYHLLGTFGAFKGDVFLQHLRTTLSKKLGGSTIRFRDLPLPLAVIASNMTRQRIEVYSVDNTPDMEVAEAVRRSMSVPLAFSARVENSIDYVDGGMLENYPIWLYLIAGTRNPYVQNTADDLQRTKLVFAVDAEIDLPQDAECATHFEEETDNPLLRMADRFAGGLIERRFVKRLSDLMALQMTGSAMAEALLAAYTKDFKLHEIKIPLKGYNWLDFDMDDIEFRGMCCRGWGTATAVVAANNLSPLRFLLPATNPYK